MEERLRERQREKKIEIEKERKIEIFGGQPYSFHYNTIYSFIVYSFIVTFFTT